MTITFILLGFIALVLGLMFTIMWDDTDEDAWMSPETRERQNRLDYLYQGHEEWEQIFGRTPTVRELWSYLDPDKRWS